MQFPVSDLSESRAHSWLAYRRWYAGLPIPPLSRIALAVLWDVALERPSDLAKITPANPPTVIVSQRTVAQWMGSTVRTVRRAIRELETAGLVAVHRNSEPYRYTLAVPVVRIGTILHVSREDKMSPSPEDAMSSQPEDKMSAEKETFNEGSDRSSPAPLERDISPKAGDGQLPGKREPSAKQRSLAFGLARRICGAYEAEQIGLEVPFVASVFGRFLAQGFHVDDVSAKALRSCSITHAARQDGLAVDLQKYWAAVFEERMDDGLHVEERTQLSLIRRRQVASQVASSIRGGAKP